ncbi:MAG: hypothetical protein U0835_14085 [Isosphaeraceae bacterium]
MGVKVQVLKRGTLFAMRRAKLYEIYRTHASLEDIPAADRASLEKTIFRLPLETVWEQTQAFFPASATVSARTRGARRSTRWRHGLPAGTSAGPRPGRTRATRPARGLPGLVRPAMAAFSDWVRVVLEKPENRRVSNVALNICSRRALAGQVPRGTEVTLPPGVPRLEPLEPAELSACRACDRSPPSKPRLPHGPGRHQPASIHDEGSDLNPAEPTRRRRWRSSAWRLFPRAEDLSSYWSNIRNRVDAITEVPPSRLAAGGLLRRRPEVARPHLRPPRRSSSAPGRLPRSTSASHRTTSKPPTRPSSSACSSRGRRGGRRLRRGTTKPFERDRVSVVLGVTGTLELVIPLERGSATRTGGRP